MDVFAFLQIIIALIFIYLIVSLVVSELQEQLAALFQWRARNLRQAINIFVGDTSTKPNEDFATKFFEEQHLASSFNQITNTKAKPDKNILWFWGKQSYPSYLDPKVFAESLMAMINKDWKLDLSHDQKLFPEQNSESNEVVKILENKLTENQFDNEKLISKLIEIAYVTKLKKNKPTVKDLTNEIANTFNEVMKRTSGVYKRNAKGVSLLLGILAASLFNIDTFHIVDRLYTDPDLRQGFDDLATKMVETNNNCLEAADTNEEKIKECQTNLEAKTKEIKTSLAESQLLPIGWDEEGWFNDPQIKAQGDLGQAALGWFISAIAISMGAPFWFDLLGKVVNVRNTVRPFPLSSQEKTQVTTSTTSPDEPVS